MNNNTQGVYKTTQKDGSTYYRVSITHKGKHISLGSFKKEDEAGYAYIEAKEILSDPEITIKKIIVYEEFYYLSFEKRISLINFRDNNIYIANPIYIMNKMFYYYLSADEILKFDADELFYYSSHKIQKRGGHIFVNDFGKQLNLVNRYGIKAHAVYGRDYIFKNGDIYDFRISNIEIINSYNGVSGCIDRKRNKYKAVIHLKGNFTVGHYDTPEEAAIAYNKAVDMLSDIGFPVKYETNEIKKLNKNQITAIYNKIKVPEKIKNAALAIINSQAP